MISASTAPLPRTAPAHSSSSLSTGPPGPPSDPGAAGGFSEARPRRAETAQCSIPNFQRQEALPPNSLPTGPHGDMHGARGRKRDSEAGDAYKTCSACSPKREGDLGGVIQEYQKENLDAQSYSSFVLTECPALEPTEAFQQLRKPPILRAAFFRGAAKLSAETDRIFVLLWRAFMFRFRYPIMTLIGLLVPVALVASACTILAHYQDVELNYVPTNMTARRHMVCNFAAYINRTRVVKVDSNLCMPPSNMMGSFGRRYDGLHMMYLPLVLHYGGFLAFVDKGGSDCQQLRLFMEKFAETVSPYLMRRTTAEDLFITFPSEKALDKYRRAAAAEKKRPIHSAFICRATAPGQLDVTIRMHVRRGTPRSFANDAIKFLRRHYTSYNSTTYFGGASFLLHTDVVGTPDEGEPYGHLTGGFLDLLTLAHVFNMDRTKVRELPEHSPVSQDFQSQWERISEAFYRMFHYFGRIPVIDSVALSRNRRGLVNSFVRDAERHLSEMLALVICISAANGQADPPGLSHVYRHLLPAWVLGPGYGVVRLFTRRAAASGCDPSSSSMQLLEKVFYSRTQKMGLGLIMAAVGPLQAILRNVSAPVRRAYSPVNFLETAMPFVPATVISRSEKPHSCAAPFVVLFVCILWQVVKAIMVDKETGFKNMLKILGISDRVLWTSWYLFFTLYNLPTLVAVAYISHYFAFQLSDIWFIIFLFMLGLVASISFALFVTALFMDGNLAAMAACAWYVLIWVPVVCQRFGSAAWDPHLQRLFMAICPAAALGVGIDIAWNFNEPYIGGIRSSTINTSSLGITLADTYITLGISIVLFTCLGAYLHKVKPTSSGSPAHPLFFLFPILSCIRRPCTLCSRRKQPKDSQELQEASAGPFCGENRGGENDGKPLLEVRSVHKKFRTWQTKKCSRGSVKAVRGVSFSVYRNEIFGLLGQNGAGKSTLISVITGSLAATSGDVLIDGVSVKQYPSLARCNIGYCPQFDVLLPYLTIEETLWLYAALRGIPRRRRKEEVAELMNMMKLSEMAKVQVVALSGGWRRRVSSSVAFLGDPTIVFLDEPTAGMDILYRRTFWDSVRGLSKGRCIVLITHMMEEADYLCDRLAIMVDGVITSEGTALSLKSRFGSGYIISVILLKQAEPEVQQANKKLRQLLQTFEHPPAITEISRHELRIVCPFSHSFQLPRLFSELEINANYYGVECAVLGFASLEEVFLNVVKLAARGGASESTGADEATNPNRLSLANNAAQNGVELNPPVGSANGRCSSSSRRVSATLRRAAVDPAECADHVAATAPQPLALRCTDSGFESCESKQAGGAPRSSSSASAIPSDPNAIPHSSACGSSWLAAHQKRGRARRGLLWQLAVLRALVAKRIRLLYRDWALVTVSFLIPLLLMGLTLYLRSAKSEPRVPLTGQQLFEYRLPKGIHSEVPYGGAGWILGALDDCYSPFMTHNNVSEHVKDNNDMYGFLLDGYFGPHDPRFGAYVAPPGQADISDETSQLEVTIWHNSTFRDSIPLHYSHLLNCIAQQRTGMTDSVFVSNQPFEDTDDKSMDGLVVGFFTVIAYSFVAAGVGKVCIVERVRKVRHQQILAQVTPFQYWISSYVVDMVLLLLPCSLIFGMMLWVDITPLVGPHQRGAFLLGTALFCFSVCPLGYAISMGLDSAMTFVIVMLLLGWSLPSIQALFTEVSGLQGMYNQYLRYAFMLLPHAALCELLTNLAMMNQLVGGKMQAEELVNWMEFSKTGCPLLYLGLTILLNWMEEEMKAGKAVQQLRRRFQHRDLSLSSGSHIDSEDAGRDVEESQNPSSLGLPYCATDGVELPLVVHRLEKTYPPPIMQRCLCCCCPQTRSSCWPFCLSCKRPQPTRALKGVSFCVPRGKCFAYIGVNGSGKTTTFNIVGSLMSQTAGSVFIGGYDALLQTEKARAKLRYCPQSDALLPTLTGAEHIYLYGCLLGLRRHQLRDFCSDFFNVIGCSKYMHTLVKSYSGGTKRKLSLGIAMLGKVDLLLLDEPTSGVDPESRQVLWRMIENAKNCQTSGKAIVLTSHSMEECEVLGDRVGIIHKGSMLCVGTPAELRSTYGHGYQIECVFVAASVSQDPSLPRRFISALQKTLPTLRVLHRMAYKVTASVAKGAVSLATIFCEVEAAKAPFALEAYVVSETTLEEVFVEVSLRADGKAQTLRLRLPPQFGGIWRAGPVRSDEDRLDEGVLQQTDTISNMSGPPFGLSSQRRKELQVAFHAFDKDKTGKLDVNEMKYLLKSIGVCLSRREQKALEAEFADRGEFDFEDLLTIGQVVYNDVAIERALVLALRKLTPKGAKTVSRTVLRDMLLNLGMGVKLTEEQVDMFLDICCSEDGKRRSYATDVKGTGGVAAVITLY
ncbi:Protein Abca14, related [Eimeria mitis]|uniref:Protein Abca14, related n=1 Tax=Eimeria mitis TaxID=44415 RepID=U6KFT1_9EIME|nr:Protein Abca14, related [Eimeria mitis]CDJ35112.1 Protein Abca14, related [Eimeria mitis]